eukprot:177181_1
MWRRSSCELHNDNDAVICIACYHLRFGRDANVLYDHIIRLKKIIKAQEAQIQAFYDYKNDHDTKAEIDQQRCDSDTLEGLVQTNNDIVIQPVNDECDRNKEDDFNDSDDSELEMLKQTTKKELIKQLKKEKK